MVRRFLTPSYVTSLAFYLQSRTKVSPRAEVELSPNLKFGRGCTVSSFVKIKSTAGPLSIGERSGPSLPAKVAFGEVERDIDLAMVPDAAVGDQVITHSGYAIRVVKGEHPLLGVETGE